ncbi:MULTISPECIES: DUF2892 domain-containing protein [unclassified Ruegeria]|uniref:YgaP family membrane protein n=1 Tax=unclassified Ruegeria TaxID=2625375 RepID=UPI001489DB56|nr:MULTISPECIES: DUF2892 domain-containing protein [unclassified Ruegeria]
MITNMGKLDRGLRIAVAVILLFVAFGTGMAGSGLLFWLAVIVAAVFGVTALVGNCPIYSIVGLKTCKDCG